MSICHPIVRSSDCTLSAVVGLPFSRGGHLHFMLVPIRLPGMCSLRRYLVNRDGLKSQQGLGAWEQTLGVRKVPRYSKTYFPGGHTWNAERWLPVKYLSWMRNTSEQLAPEETSSPLARIPKTPGCVHIVFLLWAVVCVETFQCRWKALCPSKLVFMCVKRGGDWCRTGTSGRVKINSRGS